MALYMEISVSLSAINGLTRGRAEIPDVIFLQIFSVLDFSSTTPPPPHMGPEVTCRAGK